MEVFFNELTDSRSKGNEKYKNFVVGWFDIDIGLPHSEHGKLEEFYILFNLRSLIKKQTCFINNYKSVIDLTLTNKPNSSK